MTRAERRVLILTWLSTLFASAGGVAHLLWHLS